MGRKPIDETGNIYGRLTVLRMATEEEYPRGAGKPVRWFCQCECGNTTFADGRDLRKGSRVSCGCQSREKAKILAYNLGKQNGANLTGQRFGHLLVIEKSNREEDLNKHYYMWKCQCDCGAITYVRSNYLLSGHSTTCGCGRFNYSMGGSKGEQRIVELLNKNSIIFEREKIFKDCYNGLYRYDFYLPTLKILLEYNGEQHYSYTKKFYKTKTDFLKAQERDRRKISYALAHGIKIYCIPYWEIDSLSSPEDLFAQKFLAKSKFHNDDVFRIKKREGKK